MLREKFENVSESTVKELVNIYRNYTPRIRPFDGIPELLNFISSHCKLGIISDGILSVQKRKLDALRLTNLFDHLVFPDQWGRKYWKPHLRGFKDCSIALKIKTRSMVYIGDNPEKTLLEPVTPE